MKYSNRWILVWVPIWSESTLGSRQIPECRHNYCSMHIRVIYEMCERMRMWINCFQMIYIPGVNISTSEIIVYIRYNNVRPTPGLFYCLAKIENLTRQNWKDKIFNNIWYIWNVCTLIYFSQSIISTDLSSWTDNIRTNGKVSE